ncbi:MAG: T9SS type A sorting domain-containing protein [Bacteroidetes bacterium]|nr:MAG: T9SS type A sorting domain-containing protein [Bacteroidota bacterium]
MLVKYPTTQVLQAAETKIMRPSLGYPILKNIWPTDGKFDSVIERLQMLISKDSLNIGDTLYIRLQNTLDLWGDWTLIAITPDIFTGIKDNFESKRFNMVLSPNPAKDNIHISFELPVNSDVSIYLADLIGNKVYSFAENKFYQQGKNDITGNIQLPPGTYFCTLKSGNYIETVKCIVIK